MSTELRVNDKPQTPLPKVEGLRVGIVVAEWNAHVTEALLAGALEVFKNEGYPVENILVEHVPGTVELTYGASRMMRMPVDAVIVFGCVIRGGTPHFDYVCAEASKGIAQVSMQTGVPVAFGVLTTETIQQAVERAGTKAGNKGVDCAMAAMEMVNLFKEM